MHWSTTGSAQESPFTSIWGHEVVPHRNDFIGTLFRARADPSAVEDEVQVDLRLLWLALVAPEDFWDELPAALAVGEVDLEEGGSTV